MCKPNSEIHFCTCATINKKLLPIKNDREVDKAEYEKTHYIWTLHKYLGEKDSLMMGDMIMPVESLDEQLNSKSVLYQPNLKNRFDFEYAPSEGDNLQIRKQYVYKNIRGILRADLLEYMSFIYRNCQWKEDAYDVFNDKTKQIKRGKVQYKDEQ